MKSIGSPPWTIVVFITSFSKKQFPEHTKVPDFMYRIALENGQKEERQMSRSRKANQAIQYVLQFIEL